MKTKLISLFIVALGLVTFFNAKANNNNNEILKVYFNSSNVIHLIYTAHTKSQPTVYIYDSKKNLLLTETISNNYGVARRYNFSALPEGEYFFEVVDKKVRTVKSIFYRKVIINNPKDLKVEITQGADRGRLTLRCIEVNNKPVTVKIYSKTAGILFEDTINSKGDFSRVYDLTKLDENELLFEVISDERVVTKEISLVNSGLSLSK